MTRYTKYKKTFVKSDKEIRDKVEEQSSNDYGMPITTSSNRTKAVCLQCRSRSHSLQNCPQNSKAATVCYNCGSTTHPLRDCKAKKTGELKWASCFICKEVGHISSACPKNDKGIYPRGGGCRFCGSNKHLARDCRPTETNSAGTSLIDMEQSDNRTTAAADEDHVFQSLKKIQRSRDIKRKEKAHKVLEGGAAKAKKVVNF